MAEAIHTESHWEMPHGMNQTEMASENAQQMVELKRPLLSPHPTDLSSNHLQQQQTEEEAISIDIKAMTEISEDGLFSPLCCIYKVPTKIRLQNEEAYTPKVVSIGPFHHGDERLQEMERHKEIMFKRFAQNAMTDLDSLVKSAKQSEPKVRASYFESINYDKQDLVKLILVDSAFIIQLFIMDYEDYEDQLTHDAKLSQSLLIEDICDDLLLLENQLPFFFLEELYNIAFPRNHRGDLPSFLELTYSNFDWLNKQKLEPDHKIEHFTDLLRLFYLRIIKPGRDFFETGGSDMLRYSANELQEAGVKFGVSTSKCLLDLEFSGSVLQIPQIKVTDKTEFLFRNVMALEQCHYLSETYFCDYTLVLGNLVNTNKDVEVLAHKKIISNWLGDAKEVATLINGLGKNISHCNFNTEHLDISKRLNEFYEDPWHKKKAALRRDYCNTPWQTVASIAAIILLILTITQTVCSILQVV
ncbi:UPF0481 protein At3g47200-like [Neltuma alba]|uniref:UPF0481 protein At3g47200-like n=1 Tax=Neltuma alba TaxID=207710 RepID=UPI0010A3B355|nr:UPF0481 protein At3g47200-like [Prosopis alba]